MSGCYLSTVLRFRNYFFTRVTSIDCKLNRYPDKIIKDATVPKNIPIGC